ncbi:MAG TPA: hypothetical protein VHA13_03350 [Gammaproteobacteria bacterium]|nr:hypothetical protein [Gammaproteobacteria bacterium]
MSKLKIGLASFILIAFASFASAQMGLWSNFPIIGVVTGNETVPANTNLSGGRSPQTALMSMAGLNALPLSFVTVTTPPAGISASSVSGGVVYTSATTITSANITLPSSPVQGQQYRISSNRTITTLSVTAASGDSMATNTTPTALTASTTSPQGYTFVCDKAGGSTCTWHRLQ